MTKSTERIINLFRKTLKNKEKGHHVPLFKGNEKVFK